jgi:hypothetical protein
LATASPSDEESKDGGKEGDISSKTYFSSVVSGWLAGAQGILDVTVKVDR